ncbi:MAG: hypothetical protein ACT4TC_20385 [Myxococcaceae bacterium]
MSQSDEVPLMRPGLASGPKTKVESWKARKASPAWLYAFLAIQMLCQLALLVEVFSKVRFLIRVLTFASSILLLAFLPGDGKKSPATAVGLGTICIVIMGLIHPLTNTLLAGLAQIGMYIAVLSPLFWARRISVTPLTLQRVLSLLWCFHVVSCVFGVLQVYFPGSFQPIISSVLRSQDAYLQSLTMTLDSGEKVYRPMGLTDMPGGAGMAGLYVLLLGSGFLLVAQRSLIRAGVLFGMGVGAVCLYLCQVRATAVTAAVCLIVVGVRFMMMGKVRQGVSFLSVVTVLAVLSFGVAVALGGQTIADRFSTLQEGSAGQVYYKNRGIFLEHTVENILPEYPLGAGLGRYGMMFAYFGDAENLDSPPLYAEIQWTSWIYDGGILLVFAYVAAMGLTFAFAMQLSKRRGTHECDLSLWATVLVGYNVGIFALTFSYSPFMGQIGMEYWLLNALLSAAAAGTPVARQPPALATAPAAAAQAAAA